MIRALLVAAVLAIPLAASAQEPKPLAEACPSLTPAEIAAIETYKGQFAENALYARAYCVSVAEAERRMEIQNRDAIGPKTEPGPRPQADDNAIGTLAARLHEAEAATFAGLWIEHRPQYRVVVAFTRDAAATLAKSTRDPLYVALDRPGPSLAELRATQERLMADFNRLGFRWAGAGSREDDGTIVIDLAQDAAPIRAAAARGELALPAWVVLNEPRPLPHPAPPPPPPGDRRMLGFPQFPFRTDMYPSTLLGVPDVQARLALVDGCFVFEIDGKRLTALWQASDALDLTDPSKVQVFDRLSGIRVAAGDEIVLMGLQPNEEGAPERIAGAGPCAGPYRVVKGFQPRAVWDANRRESAIAGRVRELGSRTAAEADYTADQARFDKLRAWREATLAARPDVVAEIFVDESAGTAHVFHTAAVTPEALAPTDLRGFVTGQPVPVGRGVLEAARGELAPQLAAAGIDAAVRIDALQGIVELRPADPRALSRAAVAGKIAFPAVVRIGFDNAGPIQNETVLRRRDPEAVWLRLEAAPDFAAIRALVAETALPVIEPPRPGQAAETRRMAKPSRAASLQQAQFLVAYGQTAREIAALKARGFDPVEALDAMNGRLTPRVKAILARQVVVAELVALDLRDPGKDGYRATATWRVVETLKGDKARGATIRTRLISGENPDGLIAQNGEEPLILPGLPGSLDPGSRWLLHLNDSLYRHAAYIQGGEGAARDGDWTVPWSSASPQPVVGDKVLAPFFDQRPQSLAQLRRTFAPLQRALIETGLIAGDRR